MVVTHRTKESQGWLDSMCMECCRPFSIFRSHHERHKADRAAGQPAGSRGKTLRSPESLHAEPQTLSLPLNGGELGWGGDLVTFPSPNLPPRGGGSPGLRYFF